MIQEMRRLNSIRKAQKNGLLFIEEITSNGITILVLPNGAVRNISTQHQEEVHRDRHKEKA